jgi:hypothetical protein
VEQPTVKVMAKALARIAMQADFNFVSLALSGNCVVELIDFISWLKVLQQQIASNRLAKGIMTISRFYSATYRNSSSIFALERAAKSGTFVAKLRQIYAAGVRVSIDLN